MVKEEQKKNEGKKGVGMKYLITNGARKEMYNLWTE